MNAMTRLFAHEPAATPALDVIHFRRNSDGTVDRQCGMHGWQPVLDIEEFFALPQVERSTGWWQGGVAVVLIALVIAAVVGASK